MLNTAAIYGLTRLPYANVSALDPMLNAVNHDCSLLAHFHIYFVILYHPGL
jgi:hypothetical protein